MFKISKIIAVALIALVFIPFSADAATGVITFKFSTSGEYKESYSTAGGFCDVHSDLLKKIATGEVGSVKHHNIFTYYTESEFLELTEEEVMAFCDSVWQAEGDGCVFHFDYPCYVKEQTDESGRYICKTTRYGANFLTYDHFIYGKYYLDGKLYDTDIDFVAEDWFGEDEDFSVPEVGASSEHTSSMAMPMSFHHDCGGYSLLWLSVFDYISLEEFLRLDEEEVLAFCAAVCEKQERTCAVDFDCYYIDCNDSESRIDDTRMVVKYPDGHFLQDKYYIDGALRTWDELEAYCCELDGDSCYEIPYYVSNDHRPVDVELKWYVSATMTPHLHIPYVVLNEQILGKSFDDATVDEVLEMCAKREKSLNEALDLPFIDGVIVVFEDFVDSNGAAFPEGHFLYNKYYKDGELHDLDELLSGEVELPFFPCDVSTEHVWD